MNLLLFLIFILTPTIAQAHGEKVLVTFFSQIFSFIICCLVTIFITKKIAKPYLGICGSMIGVILSLFITNQMPFLENFFLITITQFLFPIIGTGIIIFISKKYLKR
jgi:uncharacterized membrane protein YeaQ/YmgE (transglycosylase-associated protein family)